MRAPALRRYRELLQAAWVREAPVGPVDETLARVGRVLRDADIPFAVAGGFAVIEHGYSGSRGTWISSAPGSRATSGRSHARCENGGSCPSSPWGTSSS